MLLVNYGTSLSSAVPPEKMQEIQTAREQQHQAIIATIKQRLGPDLAAYYSDAIASSVSTNTYDWEWEHSDTHPRIAAYADNLVALFLREHTSNDVLVRCTMLLAFGTEQQKAQLLSLLYPESVPAVPGNDEKQPAISEQEREQIIALARQGTPRREMCARLGRGNNYYSTVKAILDAEEQA